MYIVTAPTFDIRNRSPSAAAPNPNAISRPSTPLMVPLTEPLNCSKAVMNPLKETQHRVRSGWSRVACCALRAALTLFPSRECQLFVLR